MSDFTPDREPPRGRSGEDLQADIRPRVGGGAGGSSPWLIGLGAVGLGVLVFLWLASHRPQAAHDLTADTAPAEATAPLAPAPPPPASVSAMEAAARAADRAPPTPPLIVPPPTPPPAPTVRPSPPPPAAAREPLLVVDLAAPSAEAGGAAPGQDALGGAGSKASGAPGAGKASETGLNADEQFAARVEGSEPNRARATVLKNRSAVVAQGSTIPAVLETALDSDLPGFARAVVSRDVRSFDGTSVLIPRGARVIGEYKSLASQGQSRAFVVWTRLLRPDGVSIQIGSPVTDPLGRAGLAGSVDHHYLQQFGGAVLLTLLNAGANALSGVPSTEVVVGSSTPAAGLASTASAFAPAPLPPTIKVPQGTPIRIFVARDLDFSSVEGRSP